MKEITKIYGLKALKPKNKGHLNFYECCDLTKKVFLRYIPGFLRAWNYRTANMVFQRKMGISMFRNFFSCFVFFAKKKLRMRNVIIGFFLFAFIFQALPTYTIYIFSTYLYKKYTHATKLQRWWLIPLGVIQVWGGRVYSNYLYFILKTDAQQVGTIWLLR